MSHVKYTTGLRLESIGKVPLQHYHFQAHYFVLLVIGKGKEWNSNGACAVPPSLTMVRGKEMEKIYIASLPIW